MKRLLTLIVLTSCATAPSSSSAEQQVCTIDDQEVGQCVTPLLASTRQQAAADVPDGVEYDWACHNYSNGVAKCGVVVYTPNAERVIVWCNNLNECGTIPCGDMGLPACDP